MRVNLAFTYQPPSARDVGLPRLWPGDRVVFPFEEYTVIQLAPNVPPSIRLHPDFAGSTYGIDSENTVHRLATPFPNNATIYRKGEKIWPIVHEPRVGDVFQMNDRWEHVTRPKEPLTVVILNLIGNRGEADWTAKLLRADGISQSRSVHRIMQDGTYLGRLVTIVPQWENP